MAATHSELTCVFFHTYFAFSKHTLLLIKIFIFFIILVSLLNFFFKEDKNQGPYSSFSVLESLWEIYSSAFFYWVRIFGPNKDIKLLFLLFLGSFYKMHRYFLQRRGNNIYFCNKQCIYRVQNIKYIKWSSVVYSNSHSWTLNSPLLYSSRNSLSKYYKYTCMCVCVYIYKLFPHFCTIYSVLSLLFWFAFFTSNMY